ncbi:MAG: TorF family putative porin [Steroidobacteraceae bacterium]|nr:TorF family putative porin [Steroidobacteraceae bacterium]
MRLSQGVAAALLLASGAVAHAEVTGTVTAVSDYDFRGISLSATDPALQGSIDWAGESGFYLGAWASNIDYGDDVDGDVEIDLYAGFASETEAGLGWDVGLVYYTYPGADDINDYPEIYGALSYKWLELKQWYTNDYGGLDDDAWYTEGNASFELPKNFGLNLHLGYNYGDAFDDTEYMDYSIGVGYTLGNFDLELKWVDNDLSSGDFLYTRDDVFNSEGRAILSVSTTFPWGGEE